MKQFIKKLIVGSPLEPVAQKARDLWKNKTKNEIYDRQTIEVMKHCLQPHSNCVDVGCHRGDILCRILDFSPNGKHYAFEPIPTFYEKLIEQFSEKVNIYKSALSDSIGESTFNYVTNRPAYSGFKQRQYPEPDENIEVIVVKTDFLDNIIPSENSIDFLKIDVEGGELKVLKGAIKTIARSKPIIIFEFGLGAADYYGTTPDDIYTLLHDRGGLAISLMELWLSGKKPLTREQFSRQFYKKLNYYFIAYPPN